MGTSVYTVGEYDSDKEAQTQTCIFCYSKVTSLTTEPTHLTLVHLHLSPCVILLVYSHVSRCFNLLSLCLNRQSKATSAAFFVIIYIFFIAPCAVLLHFSAVESKGYVVNSNLWAFVSVLFHYLHVIEAPNS